jgi:hydroxymethylglutaryl-CoA lyase
MASNAPGWNLPRAVRIVEVGPRDGLQNEPDPVPTADKLAYINQLAASGLSQIEVTSFVSPKAVPQLADAAELVAQLPPTGAVTFSALVPNPRGLERALAAGVRRIAVFTAASETFAEANIRMSIDRSLAVFTEVTREAAAAGVSVRAYLSTCFACPYSGPVAKDRVRALAERLLEMGADEVAISDTLGSAVPTEIMETVGHCLARIPAGALALHLHDTYGTALANVLAGLQLGITTFDGSSGGMGGCPFAPGATGNLATEDLIYLLEGMGIDTGVNLAGVAAAARRLAPLLSRPLPGRNYHRLVANPGGPASASESR